VSELREDIQTTIHDKWKDRLRFIFTELPLTHSEKLDLMYCVENSELSQLDTEFLATLTPTTEEVMPT
jgi:hypothetical protein